jgi:predicted small metal-binding protein
MRKILRCECGTQIAGPDDDELAALAADHAWRIHGMQLTREDVLSQAEPAPRAE